eukprot:1039945-Pyramimonas_sp.AAC.1
MDYGSVDLVRGRKTRGSGTHIPEAWRQCRRIWRRSATMSHGNGTNRQSMRPKPCLRLLFGRPKR